MRKQTKYLIIIVLFLPAGWFYSFGWSGVVPSNTGVRTFQAPDAERLVRNIFLKDGCANVSNIQRIGDERGVGYFENGASSLRLSAGIILATGLVSNAQGPNTSNERTSAFGDDSFDPDLRGLSTGEIFDNVGIEFDFVPQKEFVSFNYVFASEEYCEFVGSIFNDVFGFFVSGPGINGPFDRNAVNVALIPNTDEFVAINNVNHEKNKDYYVKNELRADADRCRIPYQPTFEREIEYDGFTVRLKAVFQVVPCETYHIRLVIGDVGDDQLDSAVFLESKSFDIGPEVSVDFIPDQQSASGNRLTEGCNSGSLVFARTDREKLDQDLLVNYNFTPNTSALPGIDFPELPNPLIIPANAMDLRLPFSAIADQLTEGRESMGIEIQSACQCVETDNTLVYIFDPAPPAIASDTVEVCRGEPTDLAPVFISGTPPFRYRWENGSTEPVFPLDSLSQTEAYALTVTDFCGDSLTTTLYARPQAPPAVSLTGPYEWCPPGSVKIPIQLSGTPPWQVVYQLGSNTYLLDSLTNSEITIAADQAGRLNILSITDANCRSQTNASALISDSGPRADPIITPLLCPGEANARIQLNISSSYAYQVSWDQEVNDPEAPDELAPGSYAFTITDSQDCRFSDTIAIVAPDMDAALNNGCAGLSLKKDLYIPNAFSPNSDGSNDLFRIFTTTDLQVEIRSWRIFDRWGNQLFEAQNFVTTDSSIAWDGTCLGRRLSGGVYVYQIEVETVTGAIQVLSGSVLLMR